MSFSMSWNSNLHLQICNMIDIQSDSLHVYYYPSIRFILTKE
jgi:hypothetical protein